MRFSSLSQWLQWQENLHFTEIDPGLDRVGEVWQRMGGQTKLPFKTVTVAGTNGKGSSVAITASILLAAGYRTATYTSPHLLRYNERMAINGQPCDDDAICAAFERIDQAREDVSLTYFEFATLAAADLFCRQDVDIAILEVGMGGRLDAVNLFDTDVALITPIGLDHTTWLGDNREAIGREKAGIIRAATPVVCSEVSPPHTVLDYASRLNSPCFVSGKDFNYETDSSHWSWRNADTSYESLPLPALMGTYQLQNAAAVLQVCDLLSQQGLHIDQNAVETGLKQVKLCGRFQVVPGAITRILDVTHNQQGADNLRELLAQTSGQGKTYAILAMLKDKDSQAVAEALVNVIDFWYLAGLDGIRGLSAEALSETLAPIVGDKKVGCYTHVAEAYHAAMAAAATDDRILIFGSFHTVEAAMKLMPELAQPISEAS
ncbi:bifunctional tetrahydrofolate synthase/dihydrofolate synthase [Methylophaga sp.]|uniref:bifunctional tetrahydrofolate synthase/dihydrofolate synthase n=1 Tax=Methylophaga sp. TaxID=2024840 RepID=UPI003F69F43D